jgi:hypothetical protein
LQPPWPETPLLIIHQKRLKFYINESLPGTLMWPCLGECIK